MLVPAPTGYFGMTNVKIAGHVTRTSAAKLHPLTVFVNGHPFIIFNHRNREKEFSLLIYK